MITNEELELRIRFAIGRGKNIVYYREIDDRPRATYIHVLREYRKYLIDLLNLFPQVSVKLVPEKRLFQDIIDLINPKVKTIECTKTIIGLKKLLDSYEQ